MDPDLEPCVRDEGLERCKQRPCRGHELGRDVVVELPWRHRARPTRRDKRRPTQKEPDAVACVHTHICLEPCPL